MALGYARVGGANTIVTKQSAAAAETITLDGGLINGGGDYSILGGTVDVITNTAGTLDVKIGGTTILAATVNTAAAGSFGLILSDSVADLSGTAAENITIVTSAASKCQVTLILSGTLDNPAI